MPLTGFRVIDFGQYVVGPLAGMLLADQGAEAVKVDPPGGPVFESPAGAVFNRGKRAAARAQSARRAHGAGARRHGPLRDREPREQSRRLACPVPDVAAPPWRARSSST